MENKWHQIKCQMSAMNKNAGVKEDRTCQGWGVVIFTVWLMLEQRCEVAGQEGALPLSVEERGRQEEEQVQGPRGRSTASRETTQRPVWLGSGQRQRW